VFGYSTVAILLIIMIIHTISILCVNLHRAVVARFTSSIRLHGYTAIDYSLIISPTYNIFTNHHNHGIDIAYNKVRLTLKRRSRMKKDNLNTLRIALDIKKRAEAEREAGGYVKICLSLPYVAVNCSNGDEYFFQGEEASNLIDEAEKALDGNCRIEDYILSQSQSW
jgi:hypothetical protein